MEMEGGWSVGAIRGLPITMYAPRGTRSHIKYIVIAYHMQKRGAGVQKACINMDIIIGGSLVCSSVYLYLIIS